MSPFSEHNGIFLAHALYCVIPEEQRWQFVIYHMCCWLLTVVWKWRQCARIWTERVKKISQFLSNNSFVIFKNFHLHWWGSSLPVCACPMYPLFPHRTLVDIFWLTCLQSCLEFISDTQMMSLQICFAHIFVVETWIVGLNEQRKLSSNVKALK